MYFQVPFILNSSSKELALYEKISIAADIATILGVLGILAAIGAAVVAYQNFIKSHKRKSLENAVALTHTYEQEILEQVYGITGVFAKTSVDQFISTHLNIKKLESPRFTYTEMVELYGGEKAIKDFYAELQKIDIVFLYHYHLNKKCGSKNIPSDDNVQLLFYDGDEPARLAKKEAFHSIMLMDLDHDIIGLLNSLEWFAMNFQTQIADEEDFYEALHPTFISCIQYLYVFIASRNANPSTNFYTNIVWLYNLWGTRLRNNVGLHITQEHINRK